MSSDVCTRARARMCVCVCVCACVSCSDHGGGQTEAATRCALLLMSLSERDVDCFKLVLSGLKKLPVELARTYVQRRATTNATRGE